MHLVVARNAPIHVRGEAGHFGCAYGVMTAPDVAHALDARGAEVMLVFIDPESAAGARIAGAIKGPVSLLSDSDVEHLWALAGERAGFECLTTWPPKALAYLAPDARTRPIHPRVRATLKYLEGLPPGREPALPELASFAGLSTSRFTHAFASSVGVPLRTYLLWRKLQHAVLGIALGEPLAKTALDAGFSDAAHMTRTFRRMFGTTPSELRRHSDAASVAATLST
jgi:AraC-like DNA-binding protein